MLSDTNPSLTPEACWLLNGSLGKKLPPVPAERGVDKSPFAIPEVGAEQAQVVTAAPGNKKGDEGGTPQVRRGFGGDAASPPEPSRGPLFLLRALSWAFLRAGGF